MLHLEGENFYRLLSLKVIVADQTIVVMLALILGRSLLRRCCERARISILMMTVVPMCMLRMRFRERL